MLGNMQLCQPVVPRNRTHAPKTLVGVLLVTSSVASSCHYQLMRIYWDCRVFNSPRSRGGGGGGGLGWVGLAASCRSRPSGVGVLPCPTTRLNCLTVRFQGRADYRQPPDPTEAQVGGRYRRPVCRRARGPGVGWAAGCWARGARFSGHSQRTSGHTDLPRLAHMLWALGPWGLGLPSPPPPLPSSRGGVSPGGGGVVPGGGFLVS